MSSAFRRRLAKLISKYDRSPSVMFLPCATYQQVTVRHYSGHEEFVVKSPFPDITAPQIPLHQYIWKDISLWADKVAVECSVTKKSYTYAEALTLSQSITSVFQNSFQLSKGDCVALISPNIPEYPMFFTAASEAALIITPVNFNYTSDEMSKQLRDSNAKLAVTIPSKFGVVKEAIEKNGRDMSILVIKDDNNNVDIPKGSICLESLIKASATNIKPVHVLMDDTIALPYSSGTTGLPKGVQLVHASVVANLEQQMAYPHVRLHLKTSASQQDTVLGLLPMYHIYGLSMCGLATLAAGGKLVTFPKFEPKQFIEGVVQHKIKLLYLVPPLVLFVADHPEVKAEHLKAVRDVVTGAAPIGKSDVERLQKKAPHIKLHQGYGMTETSPLAMLSHKQRLHKAASGVPCPSTWLKVVDLETGESLPAGKSGEIYMKGPQIMKGYFNREDANEDIFRDGWLRSGDIGYYDQDGDFFIIDRVKELIKVKGFQVAPAELESLLREHPDIIEAAVVGVADARAGELPRAFVVKVPESKLTEQEVVDFVANKVSEHKWLAGGVRFVPVLPKTASGKLLRRQLKDLPQ